MIWGREFHCAMDLWEELVLVLGCSGHYVSELLNMERQVCHIRLKYIILMFSAYCRYRESSPWKQRKYHQKAKYGKSTTKYLKLKNPDKAINQAPTKAARAGQAGQVKTGPLFSTLGLVMIVNRIDRLVKIVT